MPERVSWQESNEANKQESKQGNEQESEQEIEQGWNGRKQESEHERKL